MLFWSISTLFGQRAFWFVKNSNGGTVTINESAIKQWMWERVAGYVNFASGKYVVDSFSLANDAYRNFTGENGNASQEYQTAAMTVANQKSEQLNRGFSERQ